ncbi:transcription antitermination factor NusB [bacterium]|nr:transcription antitermination factor NusB [bacterium]
MSMSTGTNSRREVRSLIFHLLYALESNEYSVSVQSVVESFNNGLELDREIDEEVIATTESIVEKKDQLSAIMLPFLSHWRLDRIGCCTRLILYIAFWEMHFSKTPRTIIINEAIELAKCFAEKDAYKFVNGILDEAAKQFPEEEAGSEQLIKDEFIDEVHDEND